MTTDTGQASDNADSAKASDIVAQAKTAAEAIIADATAKAATAAAAKSTATDSHMIPKARLDEEIAKRQASEGQLAKVAEGYLAEVPDHLKGLIPENLNAVDQIAWYTKAKATGVFGAKPNVPATDGGKPEALTREQISKLPTVAKIAAGYGQK